MDSIKGYVTENTNSYVQRTVDLFLAVAKHNTNNDMEAKEYVKRALMIALPNRIYLPFAQQECMEYFISEIPLSFFESSDEYYQGMNDLSELCQRQQKGVEVICWGNSFFFVQNKHIVMI
ncbi:MAG: hypothetical protein LBT06_12315 [Hungatella sp.]|jgi:hypothetical protein|nr:hypothetical protein [Hungatella sp.]